MDYYPNHSSIVFGKKQNRKREINKVRKFYYTD